MIPTQRLYDLRAATRFCSGDDLSRFFHRQLGESSPGGNQTIASQSCEAFISSQVDRIRRENGAEYADGVGITVQSVWKWLSDCGEEEV